MGYSSRVGEKGAPSYSVGPSMKCSLVSRKVARSFDQTLAAAGGNLSIAKNVIRGSLFLHTRDTRMIVTATALARTLSCPDRPIQRYDLKRQRGATMYVLLLTSGAVRIIA